MTAVKTWWGPSTVGYANITAVSVVGQQLNDSDNAVANSFCVPRTGTIVKIGFHVVSATGTPPGYTAMLAELDSAGTPSTTPYGGSASATYTYSSAGWQWITLPTSASATVGQWAAVVVKPGGTPPDGSNYIRVINVFIAGEGHSMTYTTAWSIGYGGGAMAVEYDDGYVYGMPLSSNVIVTAMHTGTDPDEAGCKFQLPVAMTTTGAMFASPRNWGTTAAADVIIYNASDSVEVSTSITDKDFVEDGEFVYVNWGAKTLQANTIYRLVVKPTVASQNVYIMRYSFGSTTHRAAAFPSVNWMWTQRVNGGTWTDVDTDISYMGLLISDIAFQTGVQMATQLLGTPQSAELPATNFAALTLSNRRPVLAFDAATDESAAWAFIVPQGWGGTITCVITYAMASATSGTVHWIAQIEAITAGDAVDTDATTSFDTANTGSGTVPATAGYIGQVTITMTNTDSAAPGDYMRLNITRDADNAGDTATGDAYLLAVELRSAA